jgi:hypothetical protein
VDAAQAGSEDHPGALGERGVEAAGQPGMIQRLARRHEAELDVAVGAPDVLAVEDRGGSKSCTSAAMRQSSRGRVERPDSSARPSARPTSPSQVEPTSCRAPLAAPMPVTTTRRGASGQARSSHPVSPVPDRGRPR